MKYLKDENEFLKQESEVLRKKINSEDEQILKQLDFLNNTVRTLEVEKLTQEEELRKRKATYLL